MGWISWLTGIGVPVLLGSAALIAAVAAYAYIPSIKFLPDIRTPVCVALVGVGIWLIAHASGFDAARDACKEASIRAELAQVRADLAHAQEAASQARILGDRLAAAEARNMEIVNELASRPIPDACRLGGDDIKRLLNIR
jgi:hypothetical protein